MRAKGGNRKKWMNRTMAYARPGALRTKILRKMEQKGGKVTPVDPRNTSRRCARCFFVDEESRDYENYNCIMCGWYNHADRLAAKNLRLICFHKETGGRVHFDETTITGSDAVERREDYGAGNMNTLTSRLEPDNDDNIESLDRLKISVNLS